jgi:hypothetical protein
LIKNSSGDVSGAASGRNWFFFLGIFLCHEVPSAGAMPAPGRFISVMLLARLPGDFRDSGAGLPQGRWCDDRASRHARRQSE